MSATAKPAPDRPFRRRRYFYEALEPVHIGAGGYRLGRVDNTIVREPGTDLPKIPGTSLSGAARSYAAMLYEKPEAAGMAKPGPADSDCPIFHTFGSATESGGGQAGTVSIGDARIVFFPIKSLYGRVWITSPDALRLAGVGQPQDIGENRIAADLNALRSGAIAIEAEKRRVAGPGAAELQKEIPPDGLNLGWIWFPSANIDSWTYPDQDFGGEARNEMPPKHLTVLAPDKLFNFLVNRNLEVRTSVAIVPKSGTADPGKLFSYEAIPRGTWLCNEMIQDNYREFWETGKYRKPPATYRSGNKETCKNWDSPLQVAEAGLKMMAHLGVGGMGTRGFGRLKLHGGPEWKEDPE